MWMAHERGWNCWELLWGNGRGARGTESTLKATCSAFVRRRTDGTVRCGTRPFHCPAVPCPWALDAAGPGPGFCSQRIVSVNVSRNGRVDHPSSARALEVSYHA